MGAGPGSDIKAVERDTFLREIKHRRGPGGAQVVLEMRAGVPLNGKAIMEMHMEQLTSISEASRKEAGDTAEQLSDSLRSVTNLLVRAQDEMVQAVKGFRASRMAIVNETRESLGALKDLREFFMGKDYEEEMARLERLVTVCRDLNALKADGTLDAVLDSALKLATGAK